MDAALTDEGVVDHFLALVGACLYRVSVFEKGGLFNENLHIAEDLEWHQRLVDSGCREMRIQHTTLIYRRRRGSLAANADDVKRALLVVARTRLARGRGVSCSTS
jgi:hypothetical protein